MWDKEKAISHLDSNASPHSLGRCAEFVRKAIEAGGLRLQRRLSAKDYGLSLVAAGFIQQHVILPKAGDVVIIQPIPGHPHGHMAMFNGLAWVSDFRQQHGYYPGASYRRLQPEVHCYRYPA
ncbi:MAG: cytoplasmic protein [Candidatus Dactylopiibacterium carminicum]|uniref:Cytoplasmic protein n=2 Tax=Candidatus Dactylopiibacterium carminicum TaxID=857335 RepID=A0A272EXF6_9RHOO|nr:cytoplasmic protein [Candidatus Dactylopiibacterium carminicum]PAS94789.1 MAG: cytoplasmic protein [Candidatus Dactylopiibacterium carminicum]PAS97713.1 MAG: cytoplasmic protein [Candidatus Dactylopiibacterium carminicum]PAT00192.1 MAG: cytoplasmic protein [Candidatus Dactylopiibacterium carminicum]